VLKVEHLAEEDISKVVEIEDLCFSAPKSEEVFRSDLTKYWVAKEEDKIVGYIGTENVAGETHIINMGVHPDQRGKGIGKKMMAEALDARDVAFLEVRTSNLPAQKIYEHFGFKNVGLRKKYYQDNDEDAIIMRREAK
jgi:ribosomal-protein-alanine N-acetyltransferase